MRSSQRAWRRRPELLAFALIVCAIPAVSAAAEPPLPTPNAADAAEVRALLLVRTPGDERVLELLLAELTPHDWRVIELRPDARDAPAPLADIAARQQATAVVRFSEARGAIELWVAGTSGPSEETIETPGEAVSEPVLALRAAEALRARGLDFGTGRRQPTPSAPATQPKVTPLAEPRAPEHHETSGRPARSLLLELGPGVAVSPGGMGALLLFGASARAELTRELGVSASAWLPLTSPSVRGAEGSTDWTSSFFGGALDVSLATAGPVSVRSASGVFVNVTRMSGEPASGFEGRSESVVTTVPFLRTALRVALGERFGVWLAGCAGMSFPELRVRFDEREAARFGRPLLLGSAGIDASLMSFEKNSRD